MAKWLVHGKFRKIFSPDITQLYLHRTAIKKARKETKLLNFDESDPTLLYLRNLTRNDQEHLAECSKKIAETQEKVIREIHKPLEESSTCAATVPGEKQQKQQPPKHSWQAWNAIQGLQIKAIPTATTWESGRPPSAVELQVFTKGLGPAVKQRKSAIVQNKDSKGAKTNKRIRFGNVYSINLPPEPTDSSPLNTHFEQYFATPKDFSHYKTLCALQCLGPYSKHLAKEAEIQKAKEIREAKPRTFIQYIVPAIPNLPQLSKHALNPNITCSQNFLTTAATVNHLITACSSLSYERMVSSEDENYTDLCLLAKNVIDPANPVASTILDSQLLLHTTATSRKFQEAVWQLMDATEAEESKPPDVPLKSPEAPEPSISTAAIANTRPGQLQNDFNQFGKTLMFAEVDATRVTRLVGLLNNFTRALRHRGNLQTNSTTRTLTVALLRHLETPETESWESIKIADIKSYQQSPQDFMTTVANFYQHPIITVLGTIKHRGHHPEFQTQQVTVFGAHHFDPDIGVFAGISLSTLTAEVFQLKLRATQPFTELVKQAATTATHTWALPTVVIALQEAQDSLQEAGTERYTTTVIPHLQKKIVYKKSAVRYIYNSKFTNRCARPTTTQFQSLSSIRQILSNSTHFTSFDFTTGASILT